GGSDSSRSCRPVSRLAYGKLHSVGTICWQAPGLPLRTLFFLPLPHDFIRLGTSKRIRFGRRARPISRVIRARRPWAASSNWQSNSLARRRFSVRIRGGPPHLTVLRDVA